MPDTYAAEFSSRVIVLLRSIVVSPTGQEVESYAEVGGEGNGRRWAKFTPFQGTELSTSKQLQAQNAYTVKIRFDHTIKITTMHALQMVYDPTRIFHIDSCWVEDEGNAREWRITAFELV